MEDCLLFNYLGQESLQKVKKPNCVNSMLVREQCKLARKLSFLSVYCPEWAAKKIIQD